MTSMRNSALSGVLGRRLVRAALELVARADPAGPRPVDVDVARVVGVGDDGVGVRPPAGLHRRDLPRHAHVADVEDADAAETLLADRLGDPLQAAVEPAAGLLDRHDQQVADHRDVALTAGADHRGDERGRGGDLDAVGVEAVVAADEDLVAGEGEVGVPEVEEAAPLRAVLLGVLFLRLLSRGRVDVVTLLRVLAILRGVVLGLFRLGRLGLRLRVRPDGHGPPRRVVGIEEALGLRPRRDEGHVPQRLPASLNPAASWTRGSGDSSAIIASMRLISAVWSAVMSEVNAKSCESWAAPRWPRRFWTMVMAPRWCLIISSRKSRSNAFPSASARLAISSSVSMPGIRCAPGAWCASMAVTV